MGDLLLGFLFLGQQKLLTKGGKSLVLDEKFGIWIVKDGRLARV